MTKITIASVAYVLSFFLIGILTCQGVKVDNRYQVIPRDNTTNTDALNLLHCLQAEGLSNDTSIMTESSGTLIVVSVRDSVNQTQTRAALISCWKRLAYRLQLAYFICDDPTCDEDPYSINVGTLGDLASLTQLPVAFSRLRKHKPC